MRSVEDIEGILNFQEATKAKSVVSVAPVTENPELVFDLQANKTLTPLLSDRQTFRRRQDFHKFYRLNGALYFVDRRWLLDHRKLVDASTLGFEMPVSRSIDIDTYEDFVKAELLMRAMHD